jgi:hypothetical protein
MLLPHVSKCASSRQGSPTRQQTGIYKNRYTSGESIIKIGALYHNYRYIFVVNIGTHTNICYKNRYATQKCDKNRYTCHKKRYVLTCCYLYRYILYRYIFIPTFTKITTCVIKIGTRLTWARVRIRFRVRVRVRIRFRVGLEQVLASCSL